MPGEGPYPPTMGLIVESAYLQAQALSPLRIYRVSQKKCRLVEKRL